MPLTRNNKEEIYGSLSLCAADFVQKGREQIFLRVFEDLRICMLCQKLALIPKNCSRAEGEAIKKELFAFMRVCLGRLLLKYPSLQQYVPPQLNELQLEIIQTYLQTRMMRIVRFYEHLLVDSKLDCCIDVLEVVKKGQVPQRLPYAKLHRFDRTAAQQALHVTVSQLAKFCQKPLQYLKTSSVFSPVADPALAPTYEKLVHSEIKAYTDIFIEQYIVQHRSLVGITPSRYTFFVRQAPRQPLPEVSFKIYAEGVGAVVSEKGRKEAQAAPEPSSSRTAESELGRAVVM